MTVHPENFIARNRPYKAGGLQAGGLLSKPIRAKEEGNGPPSCVVLTTEIISRPRNNTHYRPNTPNPILTKDHTCQENTATRTKQCICLSGCVTAVVPVDLKA